jgi:hypothetical protein
MELRSYAELLSDNYISPSWGKMIDVGHRTRGGAPQALEPIGHAPLAGYEQA